MLKPISIIWTDCNIESIKNWICGKRSKRTKNQIFKSSCKTSKNKLKFENLVYRKSWAGISFVNHNLHTDCQRTKAVGATTSPKSLEMTKTTNKPASKRQGNCKKRAMTSLIIIRNVKLKP